MDREPEGVTRVVSNAAMWRQVLGFGLLFIPLGVVVVFYVVDDAISDPVVTLILSACCAVGLAAGFIFRRYTVGKPRSRAGKGAASSATGAALILVAAFDGPLFILILGGAGMAVFSYIVLDGVLELHHRSRAAKSAEAEVDRG